MIDRAQAKQIVAYLRKLDGELANDEVSLNAVSVGLTRLADAIEADTTVMCGVDVMGYIRRAEQGLTPAVPSEPVVTGAGPGDEESTA